MPVVFVIAQDWTFRAAVRAELLEKGINALGMESGDDIARVLRASELPRVAVVEAIAELLDDRTIQNLLRRVPVVLIASHTLTVPLPDAQAILYRPVRIGEIVDRVIELLTRAPPAE